MGLEMAAARVLAPALGNSIYVWGAVISVVMIALSLGYWLGGQVADRFGSTRALPLAIAGAGLGTVSVPLIADVTLMRMAEFGPRIGSLGASALIFFVPALLLATVSPLGVRLVATRGLDHIGRSAGSLYAVSTAGSIAGTIATSFWLIPLLALEPLIVWTGVLLCATALLSLTLPAWTARAAGPDSPAIALPSGRRSTVPATVTIAVAAVLLGTWVLAEVAPPPAINELGERVLFRADTQYHRITVTEDDVARHLRFDRSHQSAVRIDDEYESVIDYPEYLHLALALNPEARRVLVLGLGGGTVSKRFWRDYPEVHVDSVEIDPVVVEVAGKYFGLPQDSRLRVFNEDARRYVQRTDERYDIVIIDAYNADSMPFHLTTEEFFREVDSLLEPGGVVAYNIISAVEGRRGRLFRSLYRTAEGVWRDIHVFPVEFAAVPQVHSNRNIIMLATNQVIPAEELQRRIRERVDGRVSIKRFPAFADDLYTGEVTFEEAPILTDAHAPVDSLIAID